MIIDLESVFNVEGLSTALDYEIDMSGEELDGVYPFTSPVRVVGEVSNRAGIVELSADVDLVLDMPCSRCARQVKIPVFVPVDHTLVRELGNGENDELILVEELMFNVDSLIREDIFLGLPQKLLCSEECKGLCPKCGKNLNEGSCDCKPDIDPRLEALAALIDD